MEKTLLVSEKKKIISKKSTNALFYVIQCSAYPCPLGFKHNFLKFSAVFGTTFPYRPITMRPASLPPIVISK